MPYDFEPVNILSREHKRDPFSFYARLRADAPVYEASIPVFGKAWLVTRYDDVLSLLKDDGRFVKDPKNAGLKIHGFMPWWLPGSIQALKQNMLDLDDPAHKRLRMLVNKAFSRRGIEHMPDRIQAITTALLDRLDGTGPVDLVARFALPMPLTVICELLGIPPGDHPKFRRWSQAMLDAPSKLGMLASVPHVLAFVRYLKRLFKTRRAAPQDDLITALVQAEEAGDRLSENELVAMVILLLVAGHETTVNLIASGTLALLQSPDQRDLLTQDPTMIGPAVEELLRFTAPVETATERYASADTALHGQTIRRGDAVVAVLASANRDAGQFADPDRLDLGRDPNPHVAFGQGIHFCLGAQLARMEAQIAFTGLLERFPGLELAHPANTLTWRTTPAVRGLEALPVRL